VEVELDDALERGTGYRSAAFAATFRHEGSAVGLAGSGSWLIRCSIPGSGSFDAWNCYPLLVCAEWSELAADLNRIGDVVTVTAVIDPVADVADDVLRWAFPDRLIPYKRHLVVELDRFGPGALSDHHRRNVKVGRRKCEVHLVEPSSAGAEEWVGLYAELRARHQILGRADLPDESLRAQLDVPGTTVLRATVGGALAGMVVWMRSGDRVYYHLGAYNDLGYRSRAAYALFDESLGHFQGVASLAVLGSGAGVDPSAADDGLVRFKRGWGAVERTARLGGRIVDIEAYRHLVGRTGPTEPYFPAYRADRLSTVPTRAR
jgi:Acetyltransferase (GNAT) domain